MIHFINENALLYWYSAFCKVLRFFVPKEVMKHVVNLWRSRLIHFTSSSLASGISCLI